MGKRRQPSIRQATDGCNPASKRDSVSKEPSIVSTVAYARRMWEALDSPLSLSCFILARHGEWEQVARKKVNPRDYVDAFTFYVDYQAVKLMSKCPDLNTGLDTELAARRKFIECEVACQTTNHRFAFDSSPLNNEGVDSILETARKRICAILGEVPEPDRLDFDFGPGATYGVRGDTSPLNKLYSIPECTRTLLPLLPDVLGEFPGWFSSDAACVRIVQGSELTFVPKDATTDRPICIEPTLNGFIQKGLGAFIRGRLLRYGIDLRDQTVNQRLAARAIPDELCTVDFSSASDTIAELLVWNLLPIDWADTLDNFRSPRYQIEGKWYNFQKFSSMGNAYTFELETLIFFGLALACMEALGLPIRVGQNVVVYGDDVIIPKAAYTLYSEVCQVCGFTVNSAKSFSDGAFYESCGADYFEGSLVTPYRLKNAFTTPEEVNLAVNNCVRMADRLTELRRCRNPCSNGSINDVSGRVASLAGVHAWLVRHLRMEWRVYGPATSDSPRASGIAKEIGDAHIWAPWDFCTPRIGRFGYRYKMIKCEPQKLIPRFWLESWTAFEEKCYPHAGYALYLAQKLPTPISKRGGWLDDHGMAREISVSEPNMYGYAVRNRIVRKRITVWSACWTFPWSGTGYFFNPDLGW